MKSRIVVALVVALLVVAVLAAFCLLKPTEHGGPSSGQESSPYISDVSISGFVYTEDGDLFMRLKILGEADLREPITINGVHGFWFGRISVRLPDGRQTQTFEPGDYVNVFNHFSVLSGEKMVDVYLPTQWHENPCLEGVYNVTVFLKGPYNNVTVLFHKDFNLKMSLTAIVAPAIWDSWEENVTIRITNTGDVPVILQGVGMELAETRRVIGWAYAPTMEGRILVVMPGEAKTWIGITTMAGYAKEELAGKTLQVDFVLDIAGAPRRFAATLNVSFP
ncbi:MAG: hypothetical protein N3F10_04645 [Candidatus Bathyarchaeota archaeon]|nr:hypothetical protein [Candidatus Bathyarchaeota archaeon]